MEEQNNYHIHIDSGCDPMMLNLKELWRYRDLILLFTKRTISLMYKQTVLGPLWLILHPLLTSIIYTAVFTGVAGLSTDGVPALLFYLTSHALWNMFAANIKRNSITFSENAKIFGKVFFPRLTISFSYLLTSLFEFLVEFALIFVLLLFYIRNKQVTPHLEKIWLLPVIFLLVGLLSLGLGIMVSSLTIKYRDLTFVMEFGISLWMYASPVVYPLSQLDPAGLMYHVILLNPMTAPLEMFRFIMLGQGMLPWESFISAFVFTVFALFGGMLIFNRVERNFIDTI